jgi:dipeptide/tripeptide permease
VGAPLAMRRPRIGIALMAASVAWAISLVVYGNRAIAFSASSWVLIAYSLWMLGELAFAEPKPATEARSALP